jgi:ribose/xylose/arabinose/galactoside ABC-type transport system permease subunit
MSNLLNMLNVSAFAQQAVKGAIIIGAIIIYQQQAKIARKNAKE